MILMMTLSVGCGKITETESDVKTTDIRFEAVSDSEYYNREERGYYYVREDGDILLTVQRGMQNTGGYGVSIESVVGNEKHIDVTVAEENPEPGGIVTEALTYPACTVRIFIDSEEISVHNANGDEYPYLSQK